MIASWLDRLILAAGLFGLTTAPVDFAPPVPSALPGSPETLRAGEHGSLAGSLLVASPEIGDPRFSHAVILLVRHDPAGAFGIVINRPIGEHSLARILESAGGDAKGVDASVPVFAGGPVEPQIGFVLHSAEYHRPETLVLGGQLALTSSTDILRDIGRGQGPRKSLIAFGYAGWAAGQLESEFARHDWFAAPADPAVVFDEPRDRVWATAFKHRELEL